MPVTSGHGTTSPEAPPLHHPVLRSPPWPSRSSTCSRSASARRAPHTVGPMRAARMFARRLRNEELLGSVASVRAELCGSLGATGHGHGTPKAVLLGLEGDSPRTVDVETADERVETIKSSGRIRLLGEHGIAFAYDDDMVLHRRKAPLPRQRHDPVGVRRGRHGSALEDLLLGRRRLRRRRGRGGRGPHRARRHGAEVPLPHRRRAAAPVPGDGPVHLGPDAGERALLARRGRDPRGPAGDLARDAGVRRRRGMSREGHTAGRPQGPPPRRQHRAQAALGGRPAGPLHGVDHPLRHGREPRRTRPAAGSSPPRRTARRASSRRSCTTT